MKQNLYSLPMTIFVEFNEMYGEEVSYGHKSESEFQVWLTDNQVYELNQIEIFPVKV